MKAILAGTKEILDKALNLEAGSELYLACSNDHERDVLYDDLIQRRLWFIEDNLIRYEQVVIDKNTLDLHPNVILTKRNIISAYIRKADGKKTNITF